MPQLDHAPLVLGMMPLDSDWMVRDIQSHPCKERMTLNFGAAMPVTPADLDSMTLRQMSTWNHPGSLNLVMMGMPVGTHGIVQPLHLVGTGYHYCTHYRLLGPFDPEFPEVRVLPVPLGRPPAFAVAFQPSVAFATFHCTYKNRTFQKALTLPHNFGTL